MDAYPFRSHISKPSELLPLHLGAAGGTAVAVADFELGGVFLMPRQDVGILPPMHLMHIIDIEMPQLVVGGPL